MTAGCQAPCVYIKNAFPSETTETLTRKTGISFQTIQRWISSGRADAETKQSLLTAFPSKKTTKFILPIDAD